MTGVREGLRVKEGKIRERLNEQARSFVNDLHERAACEHSVDIDCDLEKVMVEFDLQTSINLPVHKTNCQWLDQTFQEIDSTYHLCHLLGFPCPSCKSAKGKNPCSIIIS